MKPDCQSPAKRCRYNCPLVCLDDEADFYDAKRFLPNIEALSQTEKKVLRLLAAGFAPKQIADMFGWTINTPRSFVCRAKRKLGAKTTIQAVVVFSRSAR